MALNLNTSFRVPPGVNELISKNLVTSAEIGRRVGVQRAAVSNWLTRHPAFAALAIPLSGNGFAFWWPQVEACLRELGLPNEAAQQLGRMPKRASVKGGDTAPKPRACWCADPGRTLDEMHQCPAGDAGEDCVAHDYLAVGGPLGYGLDPRTPIPDLTDFRDAVVAADGQERAPMTDSPQYPAPGSVIPDQPGYVVAECRHRVAASEWRAGFRTCERCPVTEQATEVPK